MKRFLLLLLCAAMAFFLCACTAGVQESEQNNSAQENTVNEIKVYSGEESLSIILESNSSTQALTERLQSGDITITVDDYGNFEKVGALGFSLPRNDRRITTEPGDVILYLGNQITFYYDTNEWEFTLLGRIPNMTRESMLAFFGGKGKVSVRLSLH